MWGGREPAVQVADGVPGIGANGVHLARLHVVAKRLVVPVEVSLAQLGRLVEAEVSVLGAGRVHCGAALEVVERRQRVPQAWPLRPYLRASPPWLAVALGWGLGGGAAGREGGREGEGWRGGTREGGGRGQGGREGV